MRQNLNIQKSISHQRSDEHFQVVYFKFEYCCAFASSINTKTAFSAFAEPFQRVSHAHPTKSSVIKSFLKNPAEIN